MSAKVYKSKIIFKKYSHLEFTTVIQIFIPEQHIFASKHVKQFCSGCFLA
jgi:hypothetical protein